MIPISRYELDQMQLVQNQTIITCEWINKFLYIDGVELQVDTSYEPPKHAVSFGTVVKCPPSIINQDEVPIETGDQVWFHHNTLAHCDNDMRVFMVEENGSVQLFYVVPYQFFYCYKKEDGEVYTINNSVDPLLLLEAIPETIIIEGGIEANHERALAGEYKSSKAIVAFTPKGYTKLKRGDVVAFGNSADVPLQYSLHSNLDGNKLLYRVREPDIYFQIQE